MIRCRFGGPAPCFDDLCHGVDTTVCGLDMNFEREIEEEIYGRGDDDDWHDDDGVDEPCGQPCEDYFANGGECECTVYGSYAARNQRALQSVRRPQ